MRMIQISEETYSRLQERAKAFEDTPEDVIRRLLDGNGSAVPTQSAVEQRFSSGGDLVSHVGRVPHNSQLRARYKGKQYEAIIRDGRVMWNGKAYTSLSSAAVGVINSTGSSRGTENGWRFWEVLTPDSDQWRLASEFLTTK